MIAIWRLLRGTRRRSLVFCVVESVVCGRCVRVCWNVVTFWFVRGCDVSRSSLLGLLTAENTSALRHHGVQ
jgi:hypothetical protein